MVNIRTKGQQGEREVCDWLNRILAECLTELDYGQPVKPVFQRNQNQSAVGGSDITNPFNLCIEVKRHEQLAVNTWWKQCLKASEEFGGTPILIYRKNGCRKWNVVTNGFLDIVAGRQIGMRVTVDHDDFEQWIKSYIDYLLRMGLWSPSGVK